MEAVAELRTMPVNKGSSRSRSSSNLCLTPTSVKYVFEKMLFVTKTRDLVQQSVSVVIA